MHLFSPIEHHFHNVFAVDVFQLQHNRWEVHTALTRAVTAVKFAVDLHGQICKYINQ